MGAHPLLVAAPGQSLEEVIRASTVRVEHVKHLTGFTAQAMGPHEVHVRDDKRGFRLPAGKFSVLRGQGSPRFPPEGAIERILVTPHLEHLDWRTAPLLVDALKDVLLARGYDALHVSSWGRLKATLAHTNEDQAVLLAHGTWRAEMRLKVALRAGSDMAKFVQRDRDGLLVSFWIWDELPG